MTMCANLIHIFLGTRRFWWGVCRRFNLSAIRYFSILLCFLFQPKMVICAGHLTSCTNQHLNIYSIMIDFFCSPNLGGILLGQYVYGSMNHVHIAMPQFTRKKWYSYILDDTTWNKRSFLLTRYILSGPEIVRPIWCVTRCRNYLCRAQITSQASYGVYMGERYFWCYQALYHLSDLQRVSL